MKVKWKLHGLLSLVTEVTSNASDAFYGPKQVRGQVEGWGKRLYLLMWEMASEHRDGRDHNSHLWKQSSTLIVRLTL